MSKLLIAEIGNSHCGDIKKAKELIRIAKESGASLVKGQAYKPEEMIKMGTMDYEFYEKCWLGVFNYTELIEYGCFLGVDVFFSTNNVEIKSKQKWLKIPNQQSANIGQEDYSLIDSENTIISFNKEVEKLPELDKSRILFANPYLDNYMHVKEMNKLMQHFKRNIGWSDHSVGIKNSLIAIKDLNVKTIEKHFCLEEDIENIFHNGKQYRDSIHSIGPKGLEKIARSLHG